MELPTHIIGSGRPNAYGKNVETYAFADGRFQIRWKGVSLPYRVFDKNQRVTHAAVTSHKLLGDQLAMIKEMQEEMDAKGPPKKGSLARGGGFITCFRALSV